MMPQGRRWQYFSEPLKRVERESRQHLVDARSVDWKVIVVLLTTAVTLTLQEYLFASENLGRVVRALGQTEAGRLLDGGGAMGGLPQHRALAGLIFWAVGTWITYVAIPGLVIKLVLRERLRDYGLRFRGMFGGSWIYLLFFAVLVPWLLFFSRTESFQARYPFYTLQLGEPLWPRFCIWELFYATQFLCLEFFFRGFVLHGTRCRFGVYSIFVMTVPYCMIHYGKPMPETLSAIGAGIALGFMSLKTRSIWLGAVLHVAVAWSMDLLALWHKGLLP
jgi:hypothetical protein